LHHADEFKVAVTNWNNGNVDGFASATGWQYQITPAQGCASQVPQTALTRTSDPEDLGAEADEAGTFASYERVSYFDPNPPAVASSVTETQVNCNLNVAFFFGNQVVRN
jgi:hypothetical protein